jgi:chitinase
MLGRYAVKAYDKDKDVDCFVTYTCVYGLGYDEVCDNQWYGITEVRGGRISYNMRDTWVPGPRTQPNWGPQHHTNYRQWRSSVGRFQGVQRTRCYCEADEFPQNALEEAWRGEAQAIRQVDGIQNGAQGQGPSFLSDDAYGC